MDLYLSLEELNNLNSFLQTNSGPLDTKLFSIKQKVAEAVGQPKKIIFVGVGAKGEPLAFSSFEEVITFVKKEKPNNYLIKRTPIDPYLNGIL